MSYSFESRVRFSEIGEDGCLTLPGVLDYFQDCCTFHAESVGLGGDVLKARDRAWVLSSWQVIVDDILLWERKSGSRQHLMISKDSWVCVISP